MRNFKKFLALVLAMLMVSACAVSVSAYNDQAAIDATDFAYAVETLTNLGVINGTDTGDFVPNGTLTRASAATIIAKLATGGKIAASANAVANFADVEGHWGLSYINYVSQRGIMDGIGGGKFAPDANLTVAEAIVLAVKAAGLKGEVAKLNELGTPTYWAANWISVADAEGLTAGINVFDYTELCSRAMFAQVAYNIFQNNDDMKEAFGLETKTAQVTAADDKVVTVAGYKFDVAAFNAALAASGSNKTAANLVGQFVTMAWSTKNNVIYSVELDTAVASADYRDDAIKYVKEDDKFVANKIEVAGVVYELGEEVIDPNKKPESIGGAIVADAKKVVLTIDGEEIDALVENETIPAFFKAIGYDDDGNGDFERVVITSYDLVVMKADGKTADDKFVNYKVDGVDLNKTSNKEVVFTGVAAVLDGETPILVDITAGDKYTVDVLEVAEVVKGAFSSYSDAKKNITIAGVKYNYLDGEFAAIDKSLIGMTVSVYTIDGKYVKFASASTSASTIIVDSADVNAEGKIVVTGYDAATYAPASAVLVGYLDGIYKTGVAAWNTAKDADGKEYNTTLNLGYLDKDAKFQNVVTLAEGLIINLKNVDGTVYYVSSNGVIAANANADKLKVDAKYFYLNGSAAKYMAAGANVLVEDKTVDAGKETGKYSDVVYTVANAFAEKASVNYLVTVNGDGKVSALFVKDGYGVVPYTTDYKTLDEGVSIVYVDKDAEDVEYVYGAATYTYKVIDLAKKEVVTITSDSVLAKGQFYLAKDGKAGDITTYNWISDRYTTFVETAGIIKTVKANGVVKTYTSTTDAYTFAQKGDAAIYDLSNTVIYNLGALYNADGALQTVEYSEATIEALAAGAAYVSALPGQLIIVIK